MAFELAWLVPLREHLVSLRYRRCLSINGKNCRHFSPVLCLKNGSHVSQVTLSKGLAISIDSEDSPKLDQSRRQLVPVFRVIRPFRH